MDKVNYISVSTKPSAAFIQPSSFRGRMDATYYSTTNLKLDDIVESHPEESIYLLGTFLKRARRVMYMTTKTYDSRFADITRVPFISGVDINEQTARIDWHKAKYVDKWMTDRYPNGLLEANTLVIKVKGPNQLATFVEMPLETALVSGTCVIAEVVGIDPFYLVAYLTSPYAEAWRTRLRQNITVEFTPYDDLAAIPVIKPSKEVEESIGNKIRKSHRLLDLAEYAERKLDRWLTKATNSEDMSEKTKQLLEHIPARTCPDSRWVTDADLTDRMDPWPHHISPRTVRSCLRKGEYKSFNELFTVVTDCRKRINPPIQPNNYYLSILDVYDDGFIDWNNASRSRYLSDGNEVLPGDILYSTLNPQERRIGVVPKEFTGVIAASTEFSILRPRDDCAELSYLLAAVLRSNWCRVQASFLTRSSSLSRRRLSEVDLHNIVVPWHSGDLFQLERLLATAVEGRRTAEKLLLDSRKNIDEIMNGQIDSEQVIAEGRACWQWLGKNPMPNFGNTTQ